MINLSAKLAAVGRRLLARDGLVFIADTSGRRVRNQFTAEPFLSRVGMAKICFRDVTPLDDIRKLRADYQPRVPADKNTRLKPNPNFQNCS